MPPSQTAGGVEDPFDHSPLPTPDVNPKTGVADRKIMFNTLGHPKHCGTFLPPSDGSHVH